MWIWLALAAYQCTAIAQTNHRRGGYARKPSQPVADRDPYYHVTHNRLRYDPYNWISDKADPRLADYLNSENDYVERITSEWHISPDEIYEEIVNRSLASQTFASYRYGPYVYCSRFPEGQIFRQHYRTAVKGGQEEIYLDVNQLSEEFPDFESILDDRMELNPSHQIVAFPMKTVEDEMSRIRFRDIKSQAWLKATIPNCEQFVWVNDRIGCYVEIDPMTFRSRAVYLFELATGRKKLILEENDETFYIEIERSSSGDYIFITSRGSYSSGEEATEVHLISLRDPTLTPQLVQPRMKGHRYFLRDVTRGFLIVTNYRAKNFKIMGATHDRFEMEHWGLMIAEKPDAHIENVICFSHWVVVEYRRAGNTVFVVFDRVKGIKDPVELSMREVAYKAGAFRNLDYATEHFGFTYESFSTPLQTWDYNLQTRQRTLVHEQVVMPDFLGNFSMSNYTLGRMYAPSRDGTTDIPISFVHHVDHVPSPSTPAFLMAYGAYSGTVDSAFSKSKISLLNRGFALFIIHVRGGGFLGQDWYDGGKLYKKQNTFFDFIDGTKELHSKAMASRKHTYAYGESAGGLVMGVLVNQAPELYRGVIAIVPFVDAVNPMLDETLPLTTQEYGEWGDPNERSFYNYMMQYSPYQNIRSNAIIPNVLVVSGFDDDMVPYWIPAKWVAKLRTACADNLVLHHIDMNAEHFGDPGRFGYTKEESLAYAFVLALEHRLPGAMDIAPASDLLVQRRDDCTCESGRHIDKNCLARWASTTLPTLQHEQSSEAQGSDTAVNAASIPT